MKAQRDMLQRHRETAESCPVRDVLDCIGDRWSVLALLTLGKGTHRFTEIKRSIGDISQRMLAQTLRTLERDGYVARKVYAVVPPKVEYCLTPLGRSLLKHIEGLVGWAEDNHAQVRHARKVYAPPAAITAL
jgi:DNA-binding HxlR family transcriptional regulator